MGFGMVDGGERGSYTSEERIADWELLILSKKKKIHFFFLTFSYFI